MMTRNMIGCISIMQLLSLVLKAKKVHLCQYVSAYLFFRWPQITCSIFPPGTFSQTAAIKGRELESD